MKVNFKKHYSTLLLAILAFSFLTRVVYLHRPVGYIFDEVYHALTAKLISRNDPKAYEWWNQSPEPRTAVDWLHPPLAKYSQAFFINAFGETTFAWRFSSVVFGTAVIWATALLAKELFEDEMLSLLAAMLASLDGLLFVLSRIAMNDIHVTFFILMTFTFYFRHLKFNLNEKHYTYSRNLLAAGVFAGLAVGTKWSGTFALMIIGILEGNSWIYHYLIRNKINKVNFRLAAVNFLRIAAALIIVPALIYILSYSHMFLQGKDFTHFKDLHYQIWHYQTTLEAEHPAQSRPWQWFLNLKPVWIAVERSSLGNEGNIYAFGNPALFWLGALAVLWTAVHLGAKRKANYGGLALAYLLMIYLAVWLPWQFSPRIMFFYHYAPAVPLLTIILAFWLRWLWQNNQNMFARKIVAAAIGMIAAAFIIWYPHWTNIPVPAAFAGKVYFLLESWK